jgi:hypothetical protein
MKDGTPSRRAVSAVREATAVDGGSRLRPRGTHHMRVIGQTGARVTIERHGYGFWRGLMDAKGWKAPHQVSFRDDLRVGRMLSDLNRAA